MRVWSLRLTVLTVALIAAVGAVALAARRPAAPPIVQPIAFNHAKHLVGETSPKLACTECHAGAERQAIAGLPSLDRCLQCHMKPQSDHVQERAVRDAAARGGPFAWQQVTRNAGHVYFSHAAHTAGAHITCTGCHGDVARWTAPPSHPDLRLENMDACIDCHRQRGASTSCRTCHR
jgi:hypothetical protein